MYICKANGFVFCTISIRIKTVINKVKNNNKANCIFLSCVYFLYTMLIFFEKKFFLLLIIQ